MSILIVKGRLERVTNLEMSKLKKKMMKMILSTSESDESDSALLREFADDCLSGDEMGDVTSREGVYQLLVYIYGVVLNVT